MLRELNKLSKKDMARFESYVRSPYFNTYKTLIKLFTYLKNKYPDITDDDVSPRKLSFVIYKEKRIKKDKIRKLISEFTLMFENFLVQTESEGHSVRNRIMLLKQLRIKNISKRFKINFKRLYSELAEKYTEGFEYYDNSVNLDYEMLSYRVDRQEDSLKYTLEFFDSADMFFMFSKLRTYIQLTNVYDPEAPENKLISGDVFFDSIIKFFEKNKKRIYRDHPEIVIVYYSFLMTKTFDDSYMDKLIAYYRSHKNKFKGRLLFTYNILLEGYLRVKISISHKPAEKKDRILLNNIHDRLFFKTNKFYKYVVEEGEGVIPKMEFDTVVDNGIALDKFNWVNKFIEENIRYASHDIKDSLYNISKSKLYFKSGDFDNSLKHLTKVVDPEPGSHLTSRILLAKVQYERGEYEAAGFVIDALRKYINDEKFHYPAVRASAMKFINYLKKLIRLKKKHDKEQPFTIGLIRKQLTNEPKSFYSSVWIMKKLEEM